MHYDANKISATIWCLTGSITITTVALMGCSRSTSMQQRQITEKPAIHQRINPATDPMMNDQTTIIHATSPGIH